MSWRSDRIALVWSLLMVFGGAIVWFFAVLVTGYQVGSIPWESVPEFTSTVDVMFRLQSSSTNLVPTTLGYLGVLIALGGPLVIQIQHFRAGLAQQEKELMTDGKPSVYSADGFGVDAITHTPQPFDRPPHPTVSAPSGEATSHEPEPSVDEADPDWEDLDAIDYPEVELDIEASEESYQEFQTLEDQLKHTNERLQDIVDGFEVITRSNETISTVARRLGGKDTVEYLDHLSADVQQNQKPVEPIQETFGADELHQKSRIRDNHRTTVERAARIQESLASISSE